MNQSVRDRYGSLRGWQGFFIIGAIITAAIGLVLLIKWLRRNGSGFFRGQRGFTLLETVLAVIIIGLIGMGVIKAIDTNARGSRVLDEKVQATNLVTAYLEGIRQLAYDATTNPYSSVNASITQPPQYSVAVNTAYGSSSDGVNIIWYSTNLSGSLKLQRITISVYRTSGNQTGERLVLSNCTFRTTRTK